MTSLETTLSRTTSTEKIQQCLITFEN